MTDEVGNIILEQLRLMRSQMSGFDQKLDSLSERMTSVENALSGIAYFLAETRGEFILHNERIEALEKA
jgi:prefoldin subunit 5